MSIPTHSPTPHSSKEMASVESNANTQAAPGGEVGEEGKEGEGGSAWLCVYEDDTWTALPARACSVGVSCDFMRRNSPKFTPRWLRVKRGVGD